MSLLTVATRILLLYSCALIFDRVSASVILFQPETGEILSPEQIFAVDIGRSRVARSASSLLDGWRRVHEVYSDINKELTNNTGVGAIRSNLAYSFGKLLNSSFALMDDKLKVMLAGTLRMFNRNRELRKTWGNILATMKTNVLIEEDPLSRVHKEDRIVIEDYTRWYSNREGYSRDTKENFNLWFTRLIGNDIDVKNDTTINFDALLTFVTKLGVRISSFLSYWYDGFSDEKDIVDVGVLRFPDITNPYMKVYHIKLTMWRTCTRTMLRQHDRSGVYGIFDSATFRPREVIMSNIRREIYDQANRDLCALFSTC